MKALPSSRGQHHKNGGQYRENTHFGTNKLAAVAKNLGKKTLWYVLLLYYTLESDEVSLGNKAIIMGALGYLILPIDLIPDVVPVLGLTDDAAAIKLAYDTVKASITPEIERKAKEKLAQWFGEKAVA